MERNVERTAADPQKTSLWKESWKETWIPHGKSVNGTVLAKRSDDQITLLSGCLLLGSRRLGGRHTWSRIHTRSLPPAMHQGQAGRLFDGYND